MMKKEEHNKHCKKIANDLYGIAIGAVAMVHVEDFDGLADYQADDNNLEYVEPYEGEFFTEDGDDIQINGEIIGTKQAEIETATMYDYFSDCLDYDYLVNSEREYKAVRVLVAWGGPSIYVDTINGKVTLDWWGESGEAYLESEAVDAIDELFGELFLM